MDARSVSVPALLSLLSMEQMCGCTTTNTIFNPNVQLNVVFLGSHLHRWKRSAEHFNGKRAAAAAAAAAQSGGCSWPSASIRSFLTLNLHVSNILSNLLFIGNVKTHAIMCVIMINGKVFFASVNSEKTFTPAVGAKVNCCKGKIKQVRVISCRSGC